MSRYFTHYPRTTLWLVPGGVLGPGLGGHELEPFYLSKVPITNRQLAAFASDWQPSPLAPGDDDPALGVGFGMAEDYAAWYAEISRKPMRLPSDEEWLYACLGGGTLHPWGEGEADEHLWHAGNTPGERLPPLDARRANGFGLYGLLGGAWEWTVTQDGPRLRGGSFRSTLEEILASAQGLDDSTSSPRPAETGFRIARGLRARR